MLFQEGNVGERFLVSTWVAIDLNKAFELHKFVKLFFGFGTIMKDIGVNFVRDYFAADFAKLLELLGNDDLARLGLDDEKFTLQMGQALFLLITLIL